ncbi:hypothetical protein BSKO_09467 [Bryopsis sp. KO-2023]|nr:hypothetical protein BSKO_09467 [Bryopsis sp. KO-2023]
MATGDICGNVERLHRELRQVRFQGEVNEVGLRMGDPVHFLPILHHVLLKFSRYVAMDISSKGYVLQGKTDQRFVECSFKVFRDVLKLKPVLTPSQFLDQGYAERKVLLLHDVVQACKAKHDQLCRSHKANSTKPKKRNVTRGSQNTHPQGKQDSCDFSSPSKVLQIIQQKQAKKRADLHAQHKATQQQQQAFDIHMSNSQIPNSDSRVSSNQDPVISSTDSCGNESPWRSNPEMEESMLLAPEHPREEESRAIHAANVGNKAGPMMFDAPMPAALQTNTHMNHMDHLMEHVVATDIPSMPNARWSNEVAFSGVAFNPADSLLYNSSWVREGQRHLGVDAPTQRPALVEQMEGFERFENEAGIHGQSVMEANCNVNQTMDQEDDEEEVPVARDWSQIRAVCESQRFPLRNPVGVPTQVNVSAENFPPPVASMEAPFPSACGENHFNKNWSGSEENNKVMEIVKEMAARLSKVESELSDTKKELVESRAEASHMRDTFNASVTIMEGRIKFLEARVKSQGNQNAKQEHPQGNPSTKQKSNTPATTKNSKPGQTAPSKVTNPETSGGDVLRELDGESRQRDGGVAQSMNSATCAGISNVKEESREVGIDDQASPVESRKTVSVLDKLQSSFARDKLSKSVGIGRPRISEWSVGTASKSNHEWGNCEASGDAGEGEPVSAIPDTAELIALLSKRNQEAQQFLRKHRLGAE